MINPPIIFIHDGNSDYLRYSLAQAVLTNPDSQVCLIGDESNSCYPFGRHYHFRDYTANAIAFSRNYLHLSPNHSSFELICFARWFILRDFMLLHKLKRAVYLDSDIMLYDNLQDDWEVATDYDIALCGIAPPVMINNLYVLDEFCRLLENSYGCEEGRRYLLQRYENMQQSGIIGGICDMTFWELLRQNRPDRILDLSLPGRNGDICDRNLQLSDGFLMNDGIKHVILRRGIPYGTRQDGSMARFKSLHFHGRKSMMRTFFHEWFDSLGAP